MVQKKHFLFASALETTSIYFIKKKYVLIWNDHKIDVSEKLAQLLKEKGLNYHFKCLNNPVELLKFPLDPNIFQAVFLIVTDVTKLSESEIKRDQIQKKIIDYVRKGGTLFGTHDLVYRRCRNKALQGAFGCQSNNFQRFSTPINAEVITAFSNHPLLTNINSSFQLDDGEVCYGEWDNDAKILIQTKEKFEFSNNLNIPLLVMRHTGNLGTLIWLNSADKSDELAKSLSEPQKEVLQLMYNAIKYSEEIKNYYRNKCWHS